DMGAPGDVGGQGVCRLDQQRVHEGLWQVPPQLPLDDVELLGEEAGWAECASVALEPSDRAVRVALLVAGDREVETTQQERALRHVQRAGLVPEPVHVPAVGEALD